MVEIRTGRPLKMEQWAKAISPCRFVSLNIPISNASPLALGIPLAFDI